MDGTEKRTALLKAAVHSVANNGLENTTTRTIGTEAGLTYTVTLMTRTSSWPRPI